MRGSGYIQNTTITNTAESVAFSSENRYTRQTIPGGEGQPFFTSFTDHANAQARLAHLSQLRELKQKIDDKFYTESLEVVEVDEEEGPGGEMDYLGFDYNNNN